MKSFFVGVLFFIVFGCAAIAQTASSVPTSVNSASILDAAGPEQRQSLSGIYLIVCPDGRGGVSFGTGFYLEQGVMVTNNHVVGTCTEQNLVAVDIANKQIRFTHVIVDKKRDLALLLPTEKLAGGFKIAAKPKTHRNRALRSLRGVIHLDTMASLRY